MHSGMFPKKLEPLENEVCRYNKKKKTRHLWWLTWRERMFVALIERNDFMIKYYMENSRQAFRYQYWLFTHKNN